MAPKADTVKRVNVSGTVTPALHEFIEEYRWSNRMSKSDVINAALEDWGKSKGFKEPEATEGETADAPQGEAPLEPEAPKATARRK